MPNIERSEPGTFCRSELASGSTTPEKLMRRTVDLGNQTRRILSGMRGRSPRLN